MHPNRNTVLEMYDSYSSLERVDSQSYNIYESFHIKGSYRNKVIALPYTFVASRMFQNSYPFALKPGIAPQVPAGDTLLV